MNELLDDGWGKEEEVIEYANAGLGERFLAFVIDTFFFFLLVGVVSYVIGNDTAVVVALGIIFLVLIGREASSKTVSIGKHLMKIQVVHIYQERVHWGRIVLRTFLKYLLVGSPVFFAIATFIAKSRRMDEQQIFMHDVVTKTKVVSLKPADKD